MKVILKKDVENVGDAGDIVEVADGYANNFLMPKGLAMLASRGAIADAEAIRRARIKREAKSQAEAEELRARLEAKVLTIAARSGEDGTLFGSVGNREIADALQQQFGLEVDRRKIPLDRPIKTAGEHTVDLKLHREVTATIRVTIG